MAGTGSPFTFSTSPARNRLLAVPERWRGPDHIACALSGENSLLESTPGGCDRGRAHHQDVSRARRRSLAS
jgi:hypothetical protein